MQDRSQALHAPNAQKMGKNFRINENLAIFGFLSLGMAEKSLCASVVLTLSRRQLFCGNCQKRLLVLSAKIKWNKVQEANARATLAQSSARLSYVAEPMWPKKKSARARTGIVGIKYDEGRKGSRNYWCHVLKSFNLASLQSPSRIVCGVPRRNHSASSPSFPTRFLDETRRWERTPI